MNQEIERKYAINYMPKKLDINKIANIEQCFIYNDKITIVRLRKITNIYNDNNSTKTEYIYTVKTKGDIEYSNKEQMIAQKYEIEANIKEDEYLRLIDKKISNTIRKTRLNISLEQDVVAEMDIYYGYLEGLITIEVEFKDKKSAENFKKPDWFGEELGYKKLSNRKLSEMTKDEFLNTVTKEFMNNNRKILDNLENNVINFKDINFKEIREEF